MLLCAGDQHQPPTSVARAKAQTTDVAGLPAMRLHILITTPIGHFALVVQHTISG